MKLHRYMYVHDDLPLSKIDPTNCKNTFEPGDEVRYDSDVNSYRIVVANNVSGVTVMWSVPPEPLASVVRMVQKQIADEIDAEILNDLANTLAGER